MHCHIQFTVTGKKDDRQPTVLLVQLDLKFHSGHVRHAYIQDDASRAIHIVLIQESLSAFVLFDFESHHAQEK